MKTIILVVIFHAHIGSTIAFQEFHSMEQCNYVRDLIYKQNAMGLEAAFCVNK